MCANGLAYGFFRSFPVISPEHWVSVARRFGTAWQSHFVGRTSKKESSLDLYWTTDPWRWGYHAVPKHLAPLPVTRRNILERKTKLYYWESLKTWVRLFSYTFQSNLKVICLDGHFPATPWHTTHCECHVTHSVTSAALALWVHHNKLTVCAQRMRIFLVDRRFYLCDVSCPHVAGVCCHPRDFRSLLLVCHLFYLRLHKH
jgi:hypothetical protein